MSSAKLPYEMQLETITHQHQDFALGIVKPNSQHESVACNKFINCVADRE